MKREFLQLSSRFNKSISITGQFISEKLDGFRFFWDGGITRGMPKGEVPWANMNRDKQMQTATGLWSRYGNVIHAPDRVLDDLPKIFLDGELYVPGLSRQEISKRVKGLNPSFKDVNLYVFDIPPLEVMFEDGRISNPHYEKEFKGIIEWVQGRDVKIFSKKPYHIIYDYLKGIESKYCIIVHQERLPYQEHTADVFMTAYIDEIIKAGGEGAIIRREAAHYECVRSKNMFKVKPWDDIEVCIIGYTAGIGKLEGLMGAMIVRTASGIEFKLSGFTDKERVLDDYLWARDNPGQEVPSYINNPIYPRTEIITIKHRGFTDAGVPSEARYYRKRLEL